MNGSTNTPPPTTSSDKLSGQLIIKAQLGDDIRKIMIHNEDLTLNELVLMMERIFAGKISNSDELTIKYLDDDGDKITLLNDSDLTVALHFHKLLRLFVLVNGQEQVNNTNSTDNLVKEGSLIDAKTFRSELQQIRNSVQTILDRLQITTNQDTSNNREKEGTTTTTTGPTAAVVSSTAREFDPYKHLQQNPRSTTPDSNRSKSSLTKRTFSNEQKAFQTTTSSAPAVDTQPQYQSTEFTDANKALSTAFQPTQMPTPHLVPTAFDQTKTSQFGAPPPSFTGMPPLPNSGASRFPTSFPPPALPNASTSSPFNSTSAPPLPPTTGQTSTFIGQHQQQQQQQQQQPQQTPVPPPPQQGGFYGQQQALSQQQRPGLSAFNNNTSNAYGQPPQQQAPTPPTSSSPATINPSYVQPTAMPGPPPLASQQPYGGYPTQNNYYNPVQQYPRT
jgi:hypothetical protein